MENNKIPKVIHYCWFGGKAIPDIYKKYMSTWKKFCPDYEIIEWNEKNFNVCENKYCFEAYKAKKWAFVSDYARLYIIYHYGGIYLDTDVELLKSLTPLICGGFGFIGFQNTIEVTTGLGFAAAPKSRTINEMLNIYANRSFIMPDGKYNTIPCPAANTLGLLECGLQIGEPWCNTIQLLGDIKVYPEEYFNPMNNDTQEIIISQNSYMIHHYAATWLGEEYRIKRLIKRCLPRWLLKERTIRVSKRHINNIREELKRCK